MAYLAEQLKELVTREGDARVEAPDGVHKMRVAIRRFRSALATYRTLFDPEVTEPLREELRWLGAVVGEVRNVEVTRARLMEAAQRMPVELRLGPVRERIHAEMTWQQHDSHMRLLHELDGLRFRRLTERLEELVHDPPFTKASRRGADRETRRRVRKSVRRLDRAAKAVADRQDEDRDRALHQVRKAAKRARYAAESATLTLGRPAEKLAERMAELQKLLGDIQDSAEARIVLRQIAVTAHLAGENSFTYGLLHAEQAHGVERTLRAYPEVLARALDPSL